MPKLDDINFANLTREEAIVLIHRTKNPRLLPLALWITQSIESQRAYEAIRVAIADADRQADSIRDVNRDIIEEVRDARLKP